MKGQFIGIKRVSGVSKKNNQPFDLRIACVVGDMSERDVQNGSSGMDVHAVTVPDEFREVLCEKNLGKKGDFSFYYSNGKEYLAYVNLDAK